MVRAIVESCSLAFSTLWLFGYSYRLNERLSQIAGVRSTVSVIRNTDSSRATVVTQNSNRPIEGVVKVLFICCLCYLARIFCLIILVVEIFLSESQHYSERISNIGWFLASLWIPTIIPVNFVMHYFH